RGARGDGDRPRRRRGARRSENAGEHRRPDAQSHADRISAAGGHGAPAGPGLHPRPAARGCAGCRRRVVRARHRLAHQEHQAQDRTRLPPSPLRSGRPRHRLQVHGGMTLAPCGPPHWKSWRGHPPWWPEGEAWPPVGPPGTQAWHRMRRHFLRRAVVFLAAVLTLTIGLSALLLWGAASLLGIARVPPGWVTLGQAAVAAFLGLGGALLAGRAFRRMAVPIGDLMAALGRVADGDN